MDHEKGNTLKVYIKQYLNRYKGCFALVAGFMIFYIFTLYLCGISAADIRYFAGLEIVFLVVSAVFCGIWYWYRLQTVKRQIRDYMQGMQTLSDTEDALEEVYMDALEQLQNKRQEEKGSIQEPAAGNGRILCSVGASDQNADLRDASAFAEGRTKTDRG